MSQFLTVVVTSSGVAVAAPQDCAAVQVQQQQGSDPPSTAYSVYSDAALTNKISDVAAGTNYQFLPSGLPGNGIFAAGQIVGYLKVATGTFSFTVGCTPNYFGRGGSVNSSLLEGPRQDKIAVVSVTGATATALDKNSGTIMLTGATAATGLTLADAVAGADDGKKLRIVATAGVAHVITAAGDGFNAKGSSGTITWAGSSIKGNTVELEAYNGHWYVVNATLQGTNITVA